MKPFVIGAIVGTLGFLGVTTAKKVVEHKWKVNHSDLDPLFENVDLCIYAVPPDLLDESEYDLERVTNK